MESTQDGTNFQDLKNKNKEHYRLLKRQQRQEEKNRKVVLKENKAFTTRKPR